MTENRAFKRRVRDRMSKTGETYTAARAQVSKKSEGNESAKARSATTDDRISDAKLVDATGKTWDGWFSILDRWGAKNRTHAEIAAFLVEQHEVPGWWAQTIAVWYERARGMRLKHQKSDGSFSVSASKTIAVPVKTLYDAFVDPAQRKRWLKDGKLRMRTARPPRGARFDWDGSPTRVIVDFDGKGPQKSVVSLAHEKLPDAAEAEAAKAAWRRRLADLKSHLET